MTDRGLGGSDRLVRFVRDLAFRLEARERASLEAVAAAPRATEGDLLRWEAEAEVYGKIREDLLALLDGMLAAERATRELPVAAVDALASASTKGEADLARAERGLRDR